MLKSINQSLNNALDMSEQVMDYASEAVNEKCK